MQDNKLSIFALGGINEIGKNMYVLEYGEEMIVIDCGAKFANEQLLGVDLILPDFTYLQAHQDKIKALIITHGHEDHIGGIPYFLRVLQVPVYATHFTLGLIELKLKEHKLLRESTLNEIHEDSILTFEHFEVTFFKVSHSIPDCLGIVFETPEGRVVHTGDFKFDLTPVNDQHADFHKMAKLGDEGVHVLISESTNAERPGFTPTEASITGHLEHLFRKARRKIFITTFASNVNRIQQVVDACVKTNRLLVLLGRSMVNVVSIAMERGYLDIPDWMLIDARDVGQFPSDRVTILVTGSQGEPLAALARLANGNMRDVRVHQEDTVIFASSPIPGNEKNVTAIVDRLFQLGANVVYGPSSVTGMHVSGHGYQEDLKLMLTLMKPSYFIPIHGEYRMLHIHRELAIQTGVDKHNCFILNNGDVVDLQHEIAAQTRSVHAGDTLIDGFGIGEVGEIVLRDRRQLAEDGIVMLILTINENVNTFSATAQTISRGFVNLKDNERLAQTIDETATITVERFKEINLPAMKRAVKKEVGQLLFQQTKRKPMIVPIIINI